MATTQAFRTAMHIPLADPDTSQAVLTLTSGDDYATGWTDAGGVTPLATAEGQILVSGPGPDFLWLTTPLDAGTF